MVANPMHPKVQEYVMTIVVKGKCKGAFPKGFGTGLNKGAGRDNRKGQRC